METMTFNSSGAFITRLMKSDPSGIRLLCPVCGELTIFAPTHELARRYGVHPGVYCSRDPKHLTALFELKEQIVE